MADSNKEKHLTLTQRIAALKESTLPDEQRLQVLITLCEGLSIKIDAILDKLFLDQHKDTP